MALLSQYKVLVDASFTLEKGEEKRVMFNPEDDAYLEDTHERKAVLIYMVDPSQDARALEIEVFARKGDRNQRISVLLVSGGNARTVIEPFNPAGLRKGDNRLTFKVTDGSGSVRISNVILMYHRRVQTL